MEKISLIYLLLDEQINEVSKIIDSGLFDITETTPKGTNLLNFSLFLGEFDIVEKLMKFNTKEKVVLPFEVTEKSNLFFEAMITDNEKFNKYFSFFKKHKINLELNFLDAINLINNSQTDIFNKPANIKKFKDLLKNSVDNIKSLDPVDTIQKIAKTNSPELLSLYFELCEFDKLPIQKHPSFILLKDVVTNPTKYYDFYIFSKNENMQDIEYNINMDGITNIDKKFKKIKSSEHFYNYFKDNTSFLSDIENLQEKSFCNTKKHHLKFVDSFSPQIEVNHIYDAIKSIDQNHSIKNFDNFTNNYLSNWAVSYFKNKIFHSDITDNEIKKYQKIFEKFNFNSFLITKNSDVEKVTLSITDAGKELKQIFNLKNDLIGDSLNLIFDSRIPDGARCQAISKKIEVSSNMTHFDTVSAIIHEYTHYIQSFDNDDDFNNNVTFIQDESKKWVNYPAKYFAPFLTNHLLKNYSDDINDKDNFILMVKKAIKNSDNVESALNLIEEYSKPFFDESINHTIFNRDKLRNNHTYDFINLYYKSQKDKDCSYDYYLWEKKDQYIKEDPNFSHLIPNSKYLRAEYWIHPKEIHARLNQAIYEEKINNTNIDINPIKLKDMKELLDECNHKLSLIFKKRLERDKALYNMEKLRNKNLNINKKTHNIQ